MSPHTPIIVLRAQPHRSRYYPGSTVKCFVHLHATTRVLDVHRQGAPNSSSSSTTQNSNNNSNSSRPASQQQPPSSIPFDQTRLYEETNGLRSVAESSSLSSGLAESSVPQLWLESLEVQLVYLCIVDKRYVTLPPRPASSSSPQSSQEAGSFVATADSGLLPAGDPTPTHSAVSDEGNGAILPSTAGGGTFPSVVVMEDLANRSEHVESIFVSPVVVSRSRTAMAAGSKDSVAVSFRLPDVLLPPTYKGTYARFYLGLHVRCRWRPELMPGSSGSAQPLAVTSLRVPLRFFSPQCPSHAATVASIPQFPFAVADVEDHRMHSESFQCQHVHMPLFPSPAVAPPLSDALIPHGEFRRGTMMSDHLSDRQRRARSGSESGSFSSLSSPSPSSSSSGPMDFIIRYEDIHTMNLVLTSTVVELGDSVRGLFLRHVADEAPIVAKIVVTVECIETMTASYLTQQPTTTGTTTTHAEPNGGGSALASQQQTITTKSVVDELSFVTLDALQLPFSIALTAARYSQSFSTDVLSLRYVLKFKFWCCESVNEIRRQQTGKKGGYGGLPSRGGDEPPPQQRSRKFLDLYQELEMDLTVLPPPESQVTTRMGASMFAS